MLVSGSYSVSNTAQRESFFAAQRIEFIYENGRADGRRSPQTCADHENVKQILRVFRVRIEPPNPWLDKFSRFGRTKPISLYALHQIIEHTVEAWAVSWIAWGFIVGRANTLQLVVLAFRQSSRHRCPTIFLNNLTLSRLSRSDTAAWSIKWPGIAASRRRSTPKSFAAPKDGEA